MRQRGKNNIPKRIQKLCIAVLFISIVFHVNVAAQEEVRDDTIKEYQSYMQSFEAIKTLDDIKVQDYEIVEKHVFDIPLVTKSTEKDEDGQFLDTEVTRPLDINQISDEDAVVLQSVPTVRFVTAIDKKYHRAAVFLADKGRGDCIQDKHA